MFGFRIFRHRPEIRDPLTHRDTRAHRAGPHDMPDTFALKCRAAQMRF